LDSYGLYLTLSSAYSETPFHSPLRSVESWEWKLSQSDTNLI